MRPTLSSTGQYLSAFRYRQRGWRRDSTHQRLCDAAARALITRAVQFHAEELAPTAQRRQARGAEPHDVIEHDRSRLGVAADEKPQQLDRLLARLSARIENLISLPGHRHPAARAVPL